jgi:DNA (cytosine-5)-methyltransferase 1
MKILNLYCGIGGNRKLWESEHDITAVELNEDIAAVYRDLYPNDNLIVGDAHQYLLDHFHEFDFIWTSPPCQTHSSFRQNIGVNFRGVKPVYPDMKLYQEIIFLQHNFKGDWIVENVHPYYKPLIAPNIELDRHYFWSNMFIFSADFERPKLRSAQIPDLEKALGFDLSSYKLPNKRQVLRNCVLPTVGKYLLEHAVS